MIGPFAIKITFKFYLKKKQQRPNLSVLKHNVAAGRQNCT